MSLHPDPLAFLRDVTVRLSIELGSVAMPLRDIAALGEDSVVVLDRLTDELLDVLVNGQRIARGEVIVQDGRFALRIVEMEGHAHASDRMAGAQHSATGHSDSPAIGAGGPA